MIKDINCVDTEKTDAALAFLFTLLHGMRPEETCGVKWSHLNFAENDFYVQNAYKTDPIFDETTMKRTGWVNQDGPLKTPESYRHLPIDILVKGLLLEHKKQHKNIIFIYQLSKSVKNFRKYNKKTYKFI